MRIFKNKLRVLICGLLIVSLGIPGVFGGGDKAKANDDDNFSSGMLIIDTADENLIPEGGEIVDVSDTTYLVDYKDSESAKQAYEELSGNPDIVASPENVFVISDIEGDLKKDVPKEMTGSLFASENRDSLNFEGMDAIALIDTGGNSDTICNLTLLEDDGLDRHGHSKKMIDAIKSINPDSNIVSIKAVNDKGIGSISSVYAGIKLAIDLKVKVINVSLVAKSMLENDIIGKAVADALASNIIVVAAAGNLSEDAAGYIPANIPGVITAGSCDEKGRLRDFSNYGDCVNWNIVSNSTSEASAKLSAFIAKNCKADENLTSVILSNLGNGLIFSTDYEEKNEEREITGEEWKEFDVSNLSREQKESICGDAEANITGFSFNEKENMAIIETSRGAVPESGDFATSDVNAPWTYGTLTIRNKVRLNGTGPVNELAAMTSTPVRDGNKYTLSARPGLNHDYYVVAFAVDYTPGSLESGSDAGIVGVNLAKSDDISYIGRFENKSTVQNNVTKSGGGFTEIYNDDGFLMTYKIWIDSNSAAAYMYRMCIWNKIDVRTSLELQHDWAMSDINNIAYEEGDVGDAKNCNFGTFHMPISRVDAAITLRDYDLVYKVGDNELIVEEGLVGKITNIKGYENQAKAQLAPNVKVDWDYSALPYKPDASGNVKIIPDKNVKRDGRKYFKYKFVVSGITAPKGSLKINLKSSGTGAPIPGVNFKIASPKGLGTLSGEGYVTDANGSVTISGFDWENTIDGGVHDGIYEITAVNPPAGYEDIKPIVVDFNADNVNSVVTVERSIGVLWRPLTIETAFESMNTKNGIFIYKIRGTNVDGQEREYTIVNDGTTSIMAQAGNYELSIVSPGGYVLKNIEPSAAFTFGEGFSDLRINLRDHGEGRARFLWNGDAYTGGINGALKTNEFRKA